MDYKEAIEFLDDVFSRCKLKKCSLQNLNKIIYLLEEGEENGKYKQIIEEIKKLLKPLNGMQRLYTAGDFLQEINYLEQKYLKEAHHEKPS